MQYARPRGASIADGTGFGHPMMVDHAGAGPGFLDRGANARNAAARLPRDNDPAYFTSRQIDALFGRDFGQP